MVPEGWNDGRVGDLIKGLESGISVNGVDRNLDQGEKGVLKVSAVSYGKFDPFAAKVIVSDSELKRAKTHPRKGQIIISRSNTEELVGASAYIEDDYFDLFLPDKLWQAKPRQNVCMKWLSYILASDHSRYVLSNLATGTSGSMKNITKSGLLGLRIVIPPFHEQHKIAKILSTWDKAIATTEKLIEASKQQKKALMQQLLTGKKRFAGFEGEWQTKSLSKCVSGSSLRNQSLLMGHEDLRSVTKARGMVPMKDQVKGESVDRCKVVRKNWFAYNPMRLNVGSICRWTESQNCLVSPDYVVFNCNEEILLTEYFDHFRSSHAWNDFMVRAGNGSVRVRIYLKDLAPLKIKLPPIEEQRKIACTLTVASNEIETLQSRAFHLKQEKKALMQQLLTGKRRVNLKPEEAA
ncbi:restriction endonuclease subunit S [Endozoicomonas euniceicola]|uniref:Restriction endonuclease subunit S n=1 Tax=Endozoicomonas euniceicola TaxID=1234143 RepID=A0ABY6GW41_9GAMM|nr:restriction endonuclease subunit S [Endozoicomonas euniceicola]UYM16970.1 restriction endonuclease subunit S [Endozoicomonas euniceicola]